ncbi:MAG: tRNA (adenosine(37)-N6)-dimethylallyltransferase MiaA [Bacteroidales bacterium]|jgi:tRNA dimethylallyltransferase|nr:tRNA (adenosine(37)-N6)-dimethylallyltransferase MiaA [Bacteroidales bacterium]
MIVILGPTATGKTKVAAKVAEIIDGEIISADSRQVFRNMDLGTGKDLDEYVTSDGRPIPYHLVDIADAGEEFNLFQFQKEFYKAYEDIILREKTPILCGGTGLYLESIIKPYPFVEVPENKELRDKFKNKTLEEIVDYLSTLRELHNKSDTTDRERAIRAAEIALYNKENSDKIKAPKALPMKVYGLDYPRNEVRARITKRLNERLKLGMIEEVEKLVEMGVSHKQLQLYGLEYKHISLYLLDELKFDEMRNLLNIAIHQFAKRQMTWFRRMERQGMKINWLKPDQIVEDILRNR